MKAITIEEATKKTCPFSIEGSNAETPVCKCSGHECMAWHETQPVEQREDHSNAQEWVSMASTRRNQRVRREGPSGCSGMYVFDALGVCLRLTDPANGDTE